MKRIAVLTSGGDAPGMNAAIRAVTRCALDQGWDVLGVRHGYVGLIEGHFTPLNARSVGGIIQQGGTVLGSTRCLEFTTLEGRAKALTQIQHHCVDGLIVVGGDGSQKGAAALSQMDIAVVGVASTIDNDLAGSDTSIGVDTALNIALEAIDRLKTTASSHQRAFLVEVMGRNCGYLALMAGIAGGAEVVAVPEVETTPDAIAHELRAAYNAARPTRSRSWLKERGRTPRRWRVTSVNIMPASASICGQRPWDMCSGADSPRPTTGCWPRVSAPEPSKRWRAANVPCSWE